MTSRAAPRTATATATSDPMQVPRVHRVLAVFDEVPAVRTLRVAPVEGAPSPFRPAQVGMVGAFGIGEAAISISSPADRADWHEYTIRRAGAITNALVDLHPGDELWVRGPFGTEWDLAAGGDVVVAAGGIGIAPLRSAIYAVLASRERFGRVTVLVGARRAELLLFHREYATWRERGIDVVATVDTGEPGWDGAVGFVPALVAGLELDPGHTTALLCGPDVMMRATADLLIARGVPADRIQLTLERNMQCGNGRCGHCQLGPVLVCRDGPVVAYPAVADALAEPER